MQSRLVVLQQVSVHWVSSTVLVTVASKVMLSSGTAFLGQQSACDLLFQQRSSGKLVWLDLSQQRDLKDCLSIILEHTAFPLRLPRAETSMGWQHLVLPVLLRNLQPALGGRLAPAVPGEQHAYRCSWPEDSWFLFLTWASASLFFFFPPWIGKFTVNVTFELVGFSESSLKAVVPILSNTKKFQKELGNFWSRTLPFWNFSYNEDSFFPNKSGFLQMSSLQHLLL